jgi:uncharacterized protein YhhL (DUF1145 family)
MIDVGPVKFPWGLAARSVTGILDIDEIYILVPGLGYQLLVLGSLCLAPESGSWNRRFSDLFHQVFHLLALKQQISMTANQG